MKRRNFFSWMAGAGLCAAGVGRGALADLAAGGRSVGGPYEGSFFVHFAADGGWDPTGFCDPHTNLHRGYDEGGIVSLGGIRYANVGDNAAFFERFADRLVNKMLHPPMESLRDESQNGSPHGLLQALSRLFKLED